MPRLSEFKLQLISSNLIIESQIKARTHSIRNRSNAVHSAFFLANTPRAKQPIYRRISFRSAELSSALLAHWLRNLLHYFSCSFLLYAIPCLGGALMLIFSTISSALRLQFYFPRLAEIQWQMLAREVGQLKWLLLRVTTKWKCWKFVMNSINFGELSHQRTMSVALLILSQRVCLREFVSWTSAIWRMCSIIACWLFLAADYLVNGLASESVKNRNSALTPPKCVEQKVIPI